MRLIDANALKKKTLVDRYSGELFIYLEDLDEAPTVDAVEVVHGYWEKAHDDLDIDRGWKCIHCNGSVYEMTYEPYQYCPHCGTKMDGDGNEN